MEIVPGFAVDSAVGLRGFMSYIFGASLGTSLFSVMVDRLAWHGGFTCCWAASSAAYSFAVSRIAVRWNWSASVILKGIPEHILSAKNNFLTP